MKIVCPDCGAALICLDAFFWRCNACAYSWSMIELSYQRPFYRDPAAFQAVDSLIKALLDDLESDARQIRPGQEVDGIGEIH